MISRRDFIKLGLCAASGLSLNSFLNGCTTPIIETKENIENIKWDANPAIPVPQDGCYSGSDFQCTSTSEGIAQMVLDEWIYITGRKPVIQTLGRGYVSTYDDYFPEQVCTFMIQNKVIPLIKYSIHAFHHGEGMDEISKGKYDEKLIKFAIKVREFGHPIFFDPFPEVNIKEAWGFIAWGGQRGSSVKKAWRHMHNIFENEGANANTIWNIQFLTEKCPLWRHPDGFYPGDDYVDWIGFTVRRRKNESLGSMRHIFNYSYKWARRKHPSKPIILNELGTRYDRHQPNWIVNSYRTIKTKYFGVKAVMYSNRCLDEVGEQCLLDTEAQNALRSSLQDIYFKKSIIKN